MVLLISTILLLLVLFISFYWLYSEKNKYRNPKLFSNLEQIRLFFETIENLDDYITWVHRDQIRLKFQPVAKFFKYKIRYYKKEKSIGDFFRVYDDFDAYIEKFNQNYVLHQKDKLAEYFNNVEGKNLDDQQRTAILTDEYSNLIIAGAGSGKTLTIVGKVKYILEHKKVRPENILLLSFTKKTVDELNERLIKLGIETRATTFHKLGYDIIKKYQNSFPALANENKVFHLVRKYLEEDIFEDSEALRAYLVYVSCYMNIPEGNETYESLGQKLDYEKGIDFQTLKSKTEHDLNKVSNQKLNTIQGERVKSVEELNIANFLYLSGIEYVYEKPYPHGDVLYRPDFYLSEYDVYLEHFGVNKNNRAPWLSSLHEQKYLEGIRWKRGIHAQNRTKLVETYSYYARDCVLYDKLRELLVAEGVQFKPVDEEKILSQVKKNNQSFGKEMIQLLVSFINLSKSSNLNYDELIELYTAKDRSISSYYLERQRIFIQFALPILKKYDEMLRLDGEIDFNDMVNLSTRCVIENQLNLGFQYIIVDEYQDISLSRFRLIYQIREFSGARLVCVGDDWQSIYRFAGSDISLFSNFEQYVGKHQKLFIEKTYRNSQSLIDITTSYILKNPKQIPKKPISNKTESVKSINFVPYSKQNAESTLIAEVDRIVAKYGNSSILVLGRHSFDIHDFIQLNPLNRIKYFEQSGQLEIMGYSGLDIQYLTVHRSKGLEADNVILLNLSNQLKGFPNKMNHDPNLSLLLSDGEDYRFAEERRLFYVALTRTRNEATLLIPEDVSVFVEELAMDYNILMEEDSNVVRKTNCPYCVTGFLVVRNNPLDGNQFVGCSHYPSCNQTFQNLQILEKSILCPGCQSGFLVKRSGKFNSFLGCTNYPNCTKIIALEVV